MKTEQIGGAMFLPPIFLPFTGRRRQRVVSVRFNGPAVWRPCLMVCSEAYSEGKNSRLQCWQNSLSPLSTA